MEEHERPKAIEGWFLKATPPANSSAQDVFAYVAVEPEELAMYVTCGASGMPPLMFIAWLAKEVDFLIEIDGCNK